jgi:hypothetical protein
MKLVGIQLLMSQDYAPELARLFPAGARVRFRLRAGMPIECWCRSEGGCRHYMISTERELIALDWNVTVVNPEGRPSPEFRTFMGETFKDMASSFAASGHYYGVPPQFIRELAADGHRPPLQSEGKE